MAGNVSIDKLVTLWQSAEMPASYIAYLCQICEPLFPDEQSQPIHPLQKIPHIVCQQTGGDAQLLNSILIAWHLLRKAARILDDFEDGDTPIEQPRGLWLNSSTSLIFSADLVLSHLANDGAPAPLVQAIRQQFSLVLAQTSYGQHLDLSLEAPSLDERWQISHLKSGRFLGLILWSSARLGTDDPATLQLYREFGELLGMMDQIHDDLLDLWSTEHIPGDLTRPTRWSLPVSYAFSVLEEAERAQLQQLLHEAQRDEKAETAARTLILASGAKLYLTVQLTVYYQRGQEFVGRMGLPAEQAEWLTAVLHQLSQPN